MDKNIKKGFPIDLHVHSSVSDGIFSPVQVLEKAIENNIESLVFTEHNCVHDNFDNIKKYGNQNGINIPFAAMEVDTVYNCSSNNFKFHLLVYGDGVKKMEFIKYTSILNELQNTHIRNLYREVTSSGISLPNFEDIFMIKEGSDFLCSQKKLFKRKNLALAISKVCNISIDEAKKLYLPKLPFSERDKVYIDIKETISLAKTLGCITVLAHPFAFINKSLNNTEILDFDCMVQELMSVGLDGIEIRHELNSNSQRSILYNLVDKYNLLVTGGSDFHGKRDEKWGTNGVTEVEFKQILNRLAKEKTA